MNKSITNLLVLAGIIITAIAAYVLFAQDSQLFLSDSSADAQLQQLLASSALFVDRSRALTEIELDTSLFQDPVFNSLKSYSPTPAEFEVGRPNPFAPVTTSTPIPQ